MAILAKGHYTLMGIKYFAPYFATIIHSPNPTYLPSSREIAVFSSVAPQGFLMGTFLIASYYSYANFQTKVVS